MIRHGRRLCLLLCLTANAISAQAYTVLPVRHDIDAQVGAGVAYVPWWMGGASYRVLPLPVVDVTYKRMLFISSGRGVGFQFMPAPNIVTGARVTYTWGRPNRDHIKHMKNLAGSVDGGVFLRYLMLPWIFTGDLLTALSSQGHEGTFGTVGLAYKYDDIPHWELIPRISLTYASDNYMDAYFGVDAGEAAATGFTQYKPHAGFRDLAVGTNISYIGIERWRIFTNLNASVLFKEAGDSDVVQNQLQFRVFLGASYAF